MIPASAICRLFCADDLCPSPVRHGRYSVAMTIPRIPTSARMRAMNPTSMSVKPARFSIYMTRSVSKAVIVAIQVPNIFSFVDDLRPGTIRLRYCGGIIGSRGEVVQLHRFDMAIQKACFGKSMFIGPHKALGTTWVTARVRCIGTSGLGSHPIARSLGAAPKGD